MSSSDHDNDQVSTARGALDSKLARLVGELGGGPDANALFDGVARRIANERGLCAWLRSRSTPLRALLATGVIGGLLLLVAMTWMRRDLAVYPPLRMILVLGSLGALLALVLTLLLRPIQRPALAPWVRPAAVASSVFGLLGLQLLPEAHHAHGASIVYGESLAFQLLRASPCIVIGLTAGILVYAFLVALDRGGSDSGPLPAVAAGIAANLVLQLLCPVTAPFHMVLGHFGVLVLLMALGSLRRPAS